MSARHVFIVNPAARTCPPDLTDRIAARFPDAQILPTRASGHATELARGAIGGGDDELVVVACGGDGTFREVAQAVGSRARLGIVPVGTVNQIALQLGITGGVEGALSVVESGAETPVYPGLCRFDGEESPRIFFIGVSCGPDADAVAGISPAIKRHTGKYAYVVSFLRRMAAGVLPIITCRFGDEQVTASQLIVLRNGSYGVDLNFSRLLSPTVGGLEVVAARGGRVSVLSFFLAAWWGPDFGGYRKGVGEGRVLVELAGTGNFQIDGDGVRARTALIEAGETPLRVLSVLR